MAFEATDVGSLPALPAIQGFRQAVKARDFDSRIEGSIPSTPAIYVPLPERSWGGLQIRLDRLNSCRELHNSDVAQLVRVSV